MALARRAKAPSAGLWLALVVVAGTGCSRKASAPSPALPVPAASLAPIADEGPVARPPDARELGYTVTGRMWDETERAVVPTSPAMRQRVQRAFDLWSRASGGRLQFSYAGAPLETCDNRSQLPFDGRIHVVLAGEFNFHDEQGFGSFNGEIPEPYQRGYLFFRPAPGASAADVITHEVGHALGLPHSATSASVLFSGPRQWGREGPPFLAEQDRADIRARWAADTSGVYSISGTVETGHEHAIAFVVAVDPRNGHAYSARSDHNGRFSIALLRPGGYRLVAKAAEISRDVAALDRRGPVPQSPAWYVADGESAARPDAGAVLALSDSRRAIRDLRVRMIDRPAPFPLAHAVRVGFDHSFLRPGEAATFELDRITVPLAAVEPYGTAPDLRVSPVRETGAGRYQVQVQVDPGAEEGERLLVARAADGRATVGLVGIHIVPARRGGAGQGG